MPALLAHVSRSFYLSIRLLPAALRAPVAVGYLLARTSDTIADAPGLPAGDRLQLLSSFMDALAGSGPATPLAGNLAATPAETGLLAAFPQVVASFRALPPDDRADVMTVLGHITRGQRLDIGRSTLDSDAQLDEYTWLVAGSVGEFWTRLGFRHLPGFADLAHDEMTELARRYGMALQLVNVLRDAGADAAIGRRYLPDLHDTARWHARARAGLECGIRYSLAVRSRRVRVASALPALIGARTLRAIEAAGAGAMASPVKVPRSQVHSLLARLAVGLGSRGRVRHEWDNAAR